MKKKQYSGLERRKFVRLDYIAPLAYKVCKSKTISTLFKGYTKDVSQSGLMCNIKGKVKKDDILWLAFDRTTLSVCKDLEQRSFLYQNGVFGKVVRVEKKKPEKYNVGIQFLTREEKNVTNIFPKIHFLEKQKRI